MKEMNMIDELFYATGWIFWYLIACVIILRIGIFIVFLALNYYSLIKGSFSKNSIFIDDPIFIEKFKVWFYWPFIRAWNNVGKVEFKK